MWQLASLFRLPSSSPPSPFHGAGFGSCFPKASFLASSFSAQLLEKPADWAPRASGVTWRLPATAGKWPAISSGGPDSASVPCPLQKGLLPGCSDFHTWASSASVGIPPGVRGSRPGSRGPSRARRRGRRPPTPPAPGSQPRVHRVPLQSFRVATSRTPDPSDAPSPGFADSHVVPSQLRTEVHVGDYSVLDTGL